MRSDGKWASRGTAAALGGLLLLALASCATGPPRFLWKPEKPIGWPSGDRPRVKVLMAYHGSRDVKRSYGFWQRLSRVFLGSDEVELIRPYGMALAQDQVLFIADPGLGAVHRLSLRDGSHRILEGPESLPFRSPIGVAAVPDGRVFVTDSVTGAVHILDPEGEPVGRFGGEELLGRPTGIAFDARRRRLLVVDTLGGRLLACTLAGKVVKQIGRRGREPGLFNFPTCVAVAPDGKVLVTDSMNFRVQVFSPDLECLRTIGEVGRGPGNFASPKGLAVDSEGHIYVVDAMFDNVQVFDPEGRLLLVFCAKGTGLGQLYLPSGIMIDARDRVFIADSGNARIQILQYSGGKP